MDIEAIPQDTADARSACRMVARQEAWPLLVACLALLALSVMLRPDPRGFGTHRQLLMPPCLFRAMTGQPCPLCGMTTGFAHMARGEVAAALMCNVLAPPAFAMTVLGALVGALSLVLGRPWRPRWLTQTLAVHWLLALLAAGWVVNIMVHNRVITR